MGTATGYRSGRAALVLGALLASVLVVGHPARADHQAVIPADGADNPEAQINVTGLGDPNKDLGRGALLAGASTVSGVVDHIFTVSYERSVDGAPQLCNTVPLFKEAYLFFSVNDAAPKKNAANTKQVTLGHIKPNGNPEDNDLDPCKKIYRGRILATDLGAAGSAGIVRFVVEVRKGMNTDGTDGGVLACDWGADGLQQAAGCDAALPTNDYEYKVDLAKPKVDAAGQLPSSIGTFGTFSGGLTTNTQVTVRSQVSDPLTAQNPQATKMDVTTLKVFLNNNQVWGTGAAVVKGNVTMDTAWPTGTTVPSGTTNHAFDAFTYFYQYDPTQTPESWTGVDNENPSNLTIRWQVTDLALNQQETANGQDTTTFRVDTTAPTIPTGNITADPAFNQTVGALKATGAGVFTLLKVQVKEPHNATSTPGTVKAHWYNRTRAQFTEPFNLTYNATNAKWEINTTTPTNFSDPTSPSGVAVNVSINVTAGDVFGRSTTVNSPDLVQIDPIGPAITMLVTANNTGGYVKECGGDKCRVRINATDANSGINDNEVKITIQNASGAWVTDPAAGGWTKLTPNTFERKMTKGAMPDFNYTTDLPDANDGTLIIYNTSARDNPGNIARSPNFQIQVDRRFPLLNETARKIWRGEAPHTFTYGAVDDAGPNATVPASNRGVGLNATSAKFHFKVNNAASFENVTLELSGETASAKIQNKAFSHLDKVFYYAEVKDKFDFYTSNGTSAEPKNYTIDLKPPTATLLPTPATSDTGRFSLVASASDEDSGVDIVVFEGRYRREGDAPSDWIVIQNTSRSIVDNLCLGGGLTYDFRVYAIDVAGNVGEKPATPMSSTVVPGVGCKQDIRVNITDPAGGSTVDAQAGQATKVIFFNAVPTGSLTTTNLIRVKIEFSPDDGKHWFVIGSNLENTGFFNWKVNAPTCEKCRLRVTATLPDGTVGEGVSAAFRITNGNDNLDLDNNNVLDRCEILYFGELSKADADADPDGDRLKTRRECELKTHPLNADTDGDGVGDGAEVKTKHDPLDPNDVPSDTELRFTQWTNTWFVLPLLFAAVTLVYLLGVTRRW